jgi:hypothetical protein
LLLILEKGMLCYCCNGGFHHFESHPSGLLQ